MKEGQVARGKNAIHKRGWTEDCIRREVTAGTIEIINGRARRVRGRVDYVLRRVEERDEVKS